MVKNNRLFLYSIFTGTTLFSVVTFAGSRSGYQSPESLSSSNAKMSGGSSYSATSGTGKVSQNILQPNAKSRSSDGAAAAQQMQIYMQVKDKSWDQLSEKEQAYARQNGIANSKIYDAWRSQLAARISPSMPAPVAVTPVAPVATPVAAVSPSMPAPAPPPRPALSAQALKELEIYNKIKDKDWNSLSTQEMNFAMQNGVNNKAEYDAWKAKQAILAADNPPIQTATVRAADVAGRRTQNRPTHVSH